MPSILLFRHGETQWNRAHRIQGQTDALSPLTLQGTLQAKAYGRALARFLGNDIVNWQVVSSPLARCVQTLSVLCDEAELDFGKVQFDDRLKEVDCGSYSGKLRRDVEGIDPDLFAHKGEQSWYFRCPNGENLADISLRLGHWLAELPHTAKVIAMTHGVAGKVIRGLYTGEPMAQALAVDSPQNAYFLLSHGTVVRHECEAE